MLAALCFFGSEMNRKLRIDKKLHKNWLPDVAVIPAVVSLRHDIRNAKNYDEFTMNKFSLDGFPNKPYRNLVRARDAIIKYNLEYSVAKVPQDEDGVLADDERIILKIWAKNHPKIHWYFYTNSSALNRQ